jgi:16S rRNA (adenine1518-N6/adenine1519-N6)-dimethyltransferase
MANHYQHKKRFGQNFLNDSGVLQQITSAIYPQLSEYLVEIGPGQGALTELLISEVKELDVIEIDRDLIEQLKEKFAACEQLTIHSSDVLKFDFNCYKGSPAKVRVIGNLPYNISTPLLFKLFNHLEAIKDMHFMLQKEVVERLTATCGDHHYGRLSIMTQYYCDTEYLFNVSPNAFTPPPKVDSAFVRLTPKAPKLVAKSIDSLSTVVREAFTYRRKTLSNSLKKLITAEQLSRLDIDPKKRPQQLTVEDFVKISNILYIE